MKMNIDLKHIRLKLDDEKKRALAEGLLKRRGLFFLLLVGVFLVYSFNVVNKAFLDINYLDYQGSNTVFASIHNQSATLDRIIGVMGQREKNLAADKARTYRDPFTYYQAGATPVVSSATPAEDGPINYRPKS